MSKSKSKSTPKFIEMSFDDWAAKFKPIQNHLVPDACHEGRMFETYGPELDFALAADDLKVWTLVDVGDDWVIIDGYRRVDRMGYFITEVAYDIATQYEVTFD